jgi:DNA (cytosine-5)-methyltransferase 1
LTLTNEESVVGIPDSDAQDFSFYEFFSGGGMVRAGLGDRWNCLFANDFDKKKGRTYEKNWGSGALKIAAVESLETTDLPGRADMAWASFPCQDLSLAGDGAGLNGDRSGAFWPFWDLIQKMSKEGRGPQIVALENVCGMLASHDGKDFAAICSAFVRDDYSYGAVMIDAVRFLPQSRPRLFIVGVKSGTEIPTALKSEQSAIWHPRMLRSAFERLPAKLKANWIWWKLPTPQTLSLTFADLVEDSPVSVDWHTRLETKRLLSMMSDVNRAKVKEAKSAGRRMVGTVYKRTRTDENGDKVQRAEVRFDDVAGCLRTPAGGSSRQLILVVDGDSVKSRLISSRETARLMGLPDEYELPDNYNEAYHLTGDGVVIPAVRHLAEHIFEPILAKVSSQVVA